MYAHASGFNSEIDSETLTSDTREPIVYGDSIQKQLGPGGEAPHKKKVGGGAYGGG